MLKFNKDNPRLCQVIRENEEYHRKLEAERAAAEAAAAAKQGNTTPSCFLTCAGPYTILAPCLSS
jgi:hypothetical protein